MARCVEDTGVERIAERDGKVGAFGAGSWGLKFDGGKVFASTIDDVVGMPEVLGKLLASSGDRFPVERVRM